MDIIHPFAVRYCNTSDFLVAPAVWRSRISLIISIPSKEVPLPKVSFSPAKLLYVLRVSESTLYCFVMGYLCND